MKTKTRAQRFNIGFIAGLAAGVIATVVMLLLFTSANGVSLPEVVGSQITALMPASVFASLHQLIGADAKVYLFYIIVVGQCLVFGLCGGLFYLALTSARWPLRVGGGESTAAPAAPVEKPSFTQGALLAAALWLLVGLIFLPLMGAGVFGTQLSLGINASMVSLAVDGLVYGLLFVTFAGWLVDRAGRARRPAKNAAEAALRRRTFLRSGLVLAAVGVVGVAAWRFIIQGAASTSAPVAKLVQQYKSKVVPPATPNYGEIHPTRFLSAEITPNDQYYLVSKNLFADPQVTASGWNLSVDGLVEHPFTLSYQELLAQPMQQQYESMMCISNYVGGSYMSNAQWEGVRLRDILQQAGVKTGVTKVVFHAVDDYSDSILLEKALEPTTLLAVRMNGVTLPQEHGYPVRMLVPGIYGMKHCKWLNRIELVNTDFQGYWQMRGWSDPAPVRMTSRIDDPIDGNKVPLNQVTYVGGVAFSGNKGISEVDVSVDGGGSWHSAILERPDSGLTWVRWQYPWRPTAHGNYTLVVRAIDLQGNVQDPALAPPAPDGSSGYDSINLVVA